jgi:hypothetical protein
MPVTRYALSESRNTRPMPIQSATAAVASALSSKRARLRRCIGGRRFSIRAQRSHGACIKRAVQSRVPAMPCDQDDCMRSGRGSLVGQDRHIMNSKMGLDSAPFGFVVVRPLGCPSTSDEDRLYAGIVARPAFLSRHVRRAGGEVVRIIGRGGSRDLSEKTMKKSSTKSKTIERTHADEILPEYDSSIAAPNKFASGYAAGRRHPARQRARPSRA